MRCSMNLSEDLDMNEYAEECDDIPEEDIQEYNIKPRRTRAERRKNDFLKKKNRVEMIKATGHCPGFGWFDEERNIIKYPNSSRLPQFFKKVSNRKIRRSNSEFTSKGNSEHKLFDYWWELY